MADTPQTFYRENPLKTDQSTSEIVVFKSAHVGCSATKVAAIIPVAGSLLGQLAA